MPQPQYNPDAPMQVDPNGVKYQVNDQGGYDILLDRPLDQGAIAPGIEAGATPTPPDMGGGIGSDAAANKAPPSAGWVDDVTGASGAGAALEGAQAQHTPPPDMGGTRGGKWGDMAAGLAGGMNTIDRNQSPLAGFAAGMSGAMTARETRRKDKRTEMLADQDRQIAAEDRKYRRGRDAVEDTRNARRDALLEKADIRAGRICRTEQHRDRAAAQHHADGARQGAGRRQGGPLRHGSDGEGGG